jgi:hypothetical protein
MELDAMFCDIISMEYSRFDIQEFSTYILTNIN